MTDRELLELAARAAGIKGCFQGTCEYYPEWGIFPERGVDHTDFWNPLTDDGDALRLAVRLHLSIEFGFCEDDAPIVAVGDGCRKVQECLAPDFKAKTRRAIVRAAAEIGKAMQ